MRQNMSDKLAQIDSSTLAVLKTLDARLASAASPAARAGMNTLTLRSAIKSAFNSSGGDTLGYVKAERKRASATFDAAAASLAECEKFGLALLGATSYLKGETKTLDPHLPGDYANHIVALKAARDATGTMIAPNTEASLNALVGNLHQKVKHHRALHDKRWQAFRVGFNKGCARIFDRAAETPGNAKAALHARAAAKYKSQAERATVQYSIAHKRFEEVRHG